MSLIIDKLSSLHALVDREWLIEPPGRKPFLETARDSTPRLR
jgi:hypothetical protein